MDELIFVNPYNGQQEVLSSALLPAIITSYNSKKGLPLVEEQMLQVSITNPVSAAAILSKISAYDIYKAAIEGGEFVPYTGKQAILSADITAVATSMTIEESTVMENGESVNILVADRSYLLMNRKPEPGEDVFATGTDANGVLRPAAEIITIDSAYSSGTTVTISRPDPNAAVRKRFAVIQEIVGVPPSYGESAQKGILVELERPVAVALTTVGGTVLCVDATGQEITVRFRNSIQQADTAVSSTLATATPESNYIGKFGVVTHYGVWCVKATGPYLNNVPALLEHAAPSQFDDTGQVDAVLALASAYLTTYDPSESGDSYSYTALVNPINRYWDPADCALKAIATGDYWVGVRAMNQAAFNADLRMSNITFVKVTVA